MRNLHNSSLLKRLSIDSTLFSNGNNLGLSYEERILEPMFKRAKGGYLYDYDGNKYIDFSCGNGNVIIGHADKRITHHVKNSISKGNTYDTPCKYAYHLAKQLKNIVPSIGKIGKIAIHPTELNALIWLIQHIRASNSKKMIIVVNNGIVKKQLSILNFVINENNISYVSLNSETQLDEVIIKHKNDICAFILEPVILKEALVVAEKDFVNRISELCSKYKIKLVVDERISAFRLHNDLFCSHHGIEPDYIMLGKNIADGYEVGITLVHEKHDVNNDLHVDVSLNYSYCPIPIIASIQLLNILQNKKLWDETSEIGKKLVDNLGNSLNCKVNGLIFQLKPPSTLSLKDWYLKLLELQVYFHPSLIPIGHLSLSHTNNDIKNLIKRVKKLV